MLFLVILNVWTIGMVKNAMFTVIMKIVQGIILATRSTVKSNVFNIFMAQIVLLTATRIMPRNRMFAIPLQEKKNVLQIGMEKTVKNIAMIKIRLKVSNVM